MFQLNLFQVTRFEFTGPSGLLEKAFFCTSSPRVLVFIPRQMFLYVGFTLCGNG